MNKATGKFLCMIMLWMPILAFAAKMSPLGYWKTIDDVSGDAKSIIHITKSKTGMLQGRVMYIFPSGLKRCQNCSGSMKNKPILGMVVMTKLQHSQSDAMLWEKGDIFNPRNGKTYKCNIRVADGGAKLEVRGYIGMPLFGRSQLWERVNSAKG